MNPANNFDSSSSSFHFPDLNEPLEPGHEHYGLIINHAPLPHRQAAASLIKSADHWNSSTAEILRVCSDCSTTKTPLWRGGPRGPKSLCNACGIRRRKARKAMVLATSLQNDSDNVNTKQYSSTEAPKIHKAEEKSCGTSCHAVTWSHQTTAISKLHYKDLAMTLLNKKSTKLFLRDEEEAAILLMALSSGLIYS